MGWCRADARTHKHIMTANFSTVANLCMWEMIVRAAFD